MAATLPLFPLNNVLFPDGSLPLQVFELRYLEMIARQHEANAPFGVVCLSAGQEVRQPAREGGASEFAPETLHPIGTLARIDDLQRPQSGLLLIRCTGTQRFRILRSEQRRLGLWVAETEPLAEDLAVPVPEDLAYLGAALQRYSKRSGPEGGPALPVPLRWNDCGWLANRWCELLPLESGPKQRLLELDSPLLRLELVADALAQFGLLPPARENEG